MENNTKKIKNAVSFVIYNKDRSKFLIVQRPADDANLPLVWGLPAGTLKEGETFEDAVLRAGKEKLGVEIKTGPLIGEGDLDRGEYTLHMKDFEVEIIDGEPSVPQVYPEVTQYVAWRWGIPKDLEDAAQKGSLCSKIYLASIK